MVGGERWRAAPPRLLRTPGVQLISRAARHRASPTVDSSRRRSWSRAGQGWPASQPVAVRDENPQEQGRGAGAVGGRQALPHVRRAVRVRVHQPARAAAHDRGDAGPRLGAPEPFPAEQLKRLDAELVRRHRAVPSAHRYRSAEPLLASGTRATVTERVPPHIGRRGSGAEATFYRRLTTSELRTGWGAGPSTNAGHYPYERPPACVILEPSVAWHPRVRRSRT
jgi:hypothetical protein